MGTTTDRHNLDHCLAIAKSMSPPPMIVPLTAVSLGQVQDAWWLCQSSQKLLGLFCGSAWEVKNLYASRLVLGKNLGLSVEHK